MARRAKIESDNLASCSIIPLSETPHHSEDDRQQALLNQIENIEPNLKIYEVVSIMFFLHINAKKTLIDLEHFFSGVKSNLVSNWCKDAINKLDKNWENKFYESIFLIKNYNVLKQFDIEAVNAVHTFNHNYLIPDVRIKLYKICENVVCSELEDLLRQMGEVDFRYKDYLEMYMLKWISEGKMFVDEKIDVGLLNNSLKEIKRDDLARNIFFYQHQKPSLEQHLKETLRLDEDYAIIDPNNVGLCVIINQEHFRPDPINSSIVLKERKGTDKDCDSLKSMLRFFKFDTEVVHNVDSDKIVNNIRDKIAKFFKPSHSIFLLIILSHGHKGVIYGTDSKPVQIVAVDHCLHLPQLQGKPKVIVIQACQGDYYIKAPKIEPDAPVTVKEWPKDTLFCMATIPFFASYRHLEKGTWYIQTLCEIFLEYPKDNILSLLTKVNRKLCNVPVFDSEDKIRSIPEFKSRLEKNLYLMKN